MYLINIIKNNIIVIILPVKQNKVHHFFLNPKYIFFHLYYKELIYWHQMGSNQLIKSHMGKHLYSLKELDVFGDSIFLKFHHLRKINHHFQYKTSQVYGFTIWIPSFSLNIDKALKVYWGNNIPCKTIYNSM